MPRSHFKGKRSEDVYSQLYDPNTETDQGQKTAAHYWELLRRNAAFENIARRWVREPRFRLLHADSEEYHNDVVHFPRCALDWMVPVSQRMELARHQVAKGRWFMDTRFNFGPITTNLLRAAPSICRENMEQSFNIQPTSLSSILLTSKQTWPGTPPDFKRQFLIAIHGDVIFEILSSHLKEAGDYLRWAAARVARQDRPEKRLEIAETLFALGQRLHDASEFQHIFGVPSAGCEPAKFKEYLDAIHKHCSEAGQIVGRYSAHKSWLGTDKAWRWFLVAEQQRWEPDNSQHMYQLAGLYSQELRQQKYSATLRQNAKLAGYRATPDKSTVIANRRSTVADFITDIRKWRDSIYPPGRWLAFMRPPAQKQPGGISTSP